MLDSVSKQDIRDFVIFTYERTQCQPRRHLHSHFSHVKAQQRSNNLPQHEMHQVY